MFCYTRIGIAIAQPGTTLFAWDEGLWNQKHRSGFHGYKALINGTRTVRGFVASPCPVCQPADWDAAVAVHPKRGPMKIADLLAIYTGHAAFHIEYVNRNLAAMK
jgi:hypothetical protein